MGSEILVAVLSGTAGAIGGIHRAHTQGQDRINRRFETIETNLSNLKHSVLHDYVLKEDFLREMQAVHNKLDRILDYLIQTANK
jgi:hypothetical protein